MRGGIPASASVTSFAAVYGASAAGDDIGELDGLWAPEDWTMGGGREGAALLGWFCCRDVGLPEDVACHCMASAALCAWIKSTACTKEAGLPVQGAFRLWRGILWCAGGRRSASMGRSGSMARSASSGPLPPTVPERAPL